MKKLILLASIALASFTTQAQDHAIGLRLGDNNGLGYELSYQHGLGDDTRLQFDLGMRSNNNVDSFKLSGTYHWVEDLSALGDGFKWFYGAGLGIGNTSIEVANVKNDETFVNAQGNVGIEYNFSVPIQLSLDARPELGVINGNSDLDLDIALGIRYTF